MMGYSLNQLYSVVGVSKQAVAQKAKRKTTRTNKLISLMNQIDGERDECGGMGLRALHHKLQPNWIGRDRFERTFGDMGYKVKKTKAYHRTTHAGKVIFPNLIEGMVLSDRWVVWQSDTTYYRIKERHFYLTTIIDIYDRCIDGYAVHDTLATEANLEALKMALKSCRKGKDAFRIHHSDRGSQYGSIAYRSLLNTHGIAISMGKSGQDNAYAERLHDTLKNQYIGYWNPTSLAELKSYTQRAISHYNKQRAHRSLSMQIPKMYRELSQTRQMHDVHIVHSSSKELDRISPHDSDHFEINTPYCRLTFVQNGQH